MDSLLETHWYVAILVLELSILEESYEPSVDIQFRILQARDAESAYERALLLGRNADGSYENSYGQTCVWTFKGLEDLRKVLGDELTDGTEVYGFIEGGSSADRVVPKARLTEFNHGSSEADGDCS